MDEDKKENKESKEELELEPLDEDKEGAKQEALRATDEISKADPLNVVGITIKDHEIIRFLGGGGFGRVYLARHKELEENRAIKFLQAVSEENRRKQIEEALFQVKLKHPNIVEVYDVATYENMPAIIMECVEGNSLRKILIDKKTLGLSEALNYSIQIAEALNFAHNLKEHKATATIECIVHLDLKPENVLVSNDGTVKLTDFGTARAISTKEIVSVSRIIGTEDYMAPERFYGEAGAPSDVWSFGVMLHEMLTGKCPRIRDNKLELNPELRSISKDIYELVKDMTDTNPRKRPNSKDVLKRLKGVQDLIKYRKTRPIRMAIGLALLALLIGSLYYLAVVNETFSGFLQSLFSTPYASKELPASYAGLSEQDALKKAQGALNSLDRAFEIFLHLSQNATDSVIKNGATQKMQQMLTSYTYSFVKRPLSSDDAAIPDDKLMDQGIRTLGEFQDAAKALAYLAQSAEDKKVKAEATLSYSFLLTNYHKNERNLTVAHYMLSNSERTKDTSEELKTSILRLQGLVEYEMDRCDLATITFAKLLSRGFDPSSSYEAHLMITDCTRRLESKPQEHAKHQLALKTVLPNNWLSLLLFIGSVGVPSIWLLIGSVKHPRKRQILLIIFFILLIFNSVINQVNFKSSQRELLSALTQLKEVVR